MRLVSGPSGSGHSCHLSVIRSLWETGRPWCPEQMHCTSNRRPHLLEARSHTSSNRPRMLTRSSPYRELKLDGQKRGACPHEGVKGCSVANQIMTPSSLYSRCLRQGYYHCKRSETAQRGQFDGRVSLEISGRFQQATFHSQWQRRQASLSHKSRRACLWTNHVSRIVKTKPLQWRLLVGRLARHRGR